ncbi:hypothetical protein DKZ29_06685 [Limosilactobacillus reuteri]|uniref:Uncharacterized protein n=1 Tax=Limosilactobacillus reuteri TaxID=1598 RepID=A0ABD6Y6I4_LIMRT|nr:hypothetical protein [Limosilactobacillus reuteri]PWT35294.1 hypothetical protein DKZ24_04360 [Limosilactobacillus reuteri]PWT37521.1 hypothetical protein DKZ35_04715 [Limosilactobacillus reuteri]PWT55736.1 hypothetical protein DKZ31_01200 [Limosilactobacillus reuteri]PWT58086.1 hypothetical protein DKZ29_06685 [Limosilactobacillus reuteri]PWT60005.1 hypothetical protein DKZ30_04280 [Limosilactobacillus reuteri]
MKNIINNNANQTQAMDLYMGRNDEVLVSMLQIAKENNIDFLKFEDDYIFFINYREIAGMNQSTDYKYFITIAEGSIKEDVNFERAWFLTNDDEKVDKIKAYKTVNELNEEKNLGIKNTDNLDGKIFPDRWDREEMAVSGMYLGRPS